jgi:hypothetical protein
MAICDALYMLTYHRRSAPQRLASSVGEKLVACRQILTAAGECEDDICTEGCFTKGD